MADRKTATTVEEQIAQLQSRGMKIYPSGIDLIGSYITKGTGLACTFYFIIIDFISLKEQAMSVTQACSLYL